MKHKPFLLACVVLIACSFAGAQSQSSKPQEATKEKPSKESMASNQAAPKLEDWQTSWATFVELHNKSLKEGGDANVVQFVGKVVVWEGTISNLKDGKVWIDMGPPPIRDGMGNAADDNVYSFEPTAEQAEKWKTVAKSQRVRFRTTTTAKGGLFGNGVFSFLRAGGANLSIFHSEGAELIEIIDVKK
jgi:hypothetical protein